MTRLIALRAYVPSFAVMLSVALAGCGDSSNPKHDSGADTAAASAQDTSVDRAPASTSSDAGTTDVLMMDLLQPIDAQPRMPADASVPDLAPTETSSPDAPVGGAVDAAPIVSNDGAVASVDAPPATDTNVVPSTADVAPVDARSAVDAGNVDIGNATQKLGVVLLEEASMSMNVAGLGIMTVISSTATAAFGVTQGSATCETTTSGDCQLMKCSSTSPSAATNYLAAGTVTINGLSAPFSPILQSSNAYMSTPYASYMWTSSQPLTVLVSGSSDVPAFSLAVTAPNPISLTSPTAQGYASNGLPNYTVSRATDLSVKWTGGIEGTVSVSLSNGDKTANPTVTQITCLVAASKGAVVIPATFLAKLASSVNFTVGQTNVAWATVGDWLMEFSASVVAAPGVAAFSD